MGLMPAVLSGAASATPFLQTVVLVPVFPALDLAAAAPTAANATVARGLWLQRMHPRLSRELLRGGPIRAAVSGTLGDVGVACLLVRLVAVGLPAWAGAAAAMLTVTAVVRLEHGVVDRSYVPAHSEATLRSRALRPGRRRSS